MNRLLPVIFYFLVGILFLVCSQRSSLRLQTNDKPSAQQSNKICSGSNERFGFKVDTSVSSTNFVGRKLKNRLFIVGFIAIFVATHANFDCVFSLCPIFLSSPYEEISLVSRSLLFPRRWVLDFQE